MKNDNQDRIEAYRKDATIEKQLHLVNRDFNEIEKSLSISGEEPLQPLVFVVGIQRSGSTLLMQLLSECFSFTYPDNIVARFWEAPYLGVIISRSLRAQYKNRNRARNLYTSEYGVTDDLFGPHEFGYFWTKWFGFEPIHELTEMQLKDVDSRGLRRSLFLMEHFGSYPLLFKIIALSLNLDFLAHVFPKALFVRVRRDLTYAAQSTYLARIKRYADEDAWWSLKPAQFEVLRRLSPIDQVAGQVYYSNRRIEDCLKRVPTSRQITVDYEAICKNPVETIERIREFFGSGISVQRTDIPESFPTGNTRKVEDTLFDRLNKSLDIFPAPSVPI